MGISQDWSSKLVGDYRLLHRIGGGSFGEVYQAEDLREHSKVAVKLIKAPLTQREDLKAFLNEARSMRLRHPHIVPLLDFGLSEHDLPFLVMEYVDGGTLRDRYPKGSQVPLATVVDLTIQIASALQYAHNRHLMHRDVKPENMLCRSDGTVLLSDFGIASVAYASGSANNYQSFGGTLPYMAPEQHTGKPRPASDQYALAVVAYEWLAGTRPFQGTVSELVSQHLHASPPSLLDQVPGLPIEVELAIFKALSKQPQERFARVDEFAAALQATSQSSSIPPTPLASLPQTSSSPPLTNPQVTRPPVEIRENIAPSPYRTEIERSLPLEVISSRRSSADTPYAKKVPGEPLTLTPRPDQYRKTSDKRFTFFFTLGTILSVILVFVLAGISLFYFGFGSQNISTLFITPARTAKFPSAPTKIPTLSPVQVTAATATAAAQAYATATAGQGAMLGFDPPHTNLNPYQHIIGPGNVSRLTRLWSFATGSSVTSSPAVAGGMVYVGSSDDKLYAFDASCRKNCQPLWSFATGGSIDFSSPAVAGGMVYIGSTDHKLYAFDATCRANCQPLWSFASGYKIFSSPTVAGGMVYIGSDDGSLYVFDATCRANCQPLWSFASGYAIDSSPAIAGDMVYVGAANGTFYAFDASCRVNCLPLWNFTFGTGISAPPTVAGGMVYIGSNDGTFYAFDASCRQKCQPLWNFATGSIIHYSPAVAGGMVYVSSFKLYLFDASCRKSCQPLWSVGAKISMDSSPVVAGGVVYLGFINGDFYAIDAACRKNCQPLWGIAAANNIESSPAIANGIVYLGSNDGKLYAFGLPS